MAEPNPAEQPIEPLSAKDSLASRRSQRWRRRLLWGTGALLGGALGISLGGGWWFQQRLAPLIAQHLTLFLNRPVQIGELQYFSLTYLRFGESEISPVGHDPDRVRMSAVEVHYNPLSYLLDRKLKVEVTAVNPEIFLEQGENQDWLRTPLRPLRPDHPIDLVRLRLRQAQATVITRSPDGTIRPAVNLTVPEANAQFDWRDREIQFDLNGHFAQGDRLSLRGVSQLQSRHLTLQLQGKNLPARIVSHLLPLPLRAEQGTLDSHLNLDWQGSQSPRWTGTTDLRGVTLFFRQLPRPLTQLEGLLRFQGDRIQFEQVKTAYETITGVVQGAIYPHQGFLLQGEIPPTPMQSWVTSLKLPLGVPVQGSLKTQLTLTGPFERPLLTADLHTVGTSRVDRLPWRSLQARLALKDSILSIRQLEAIPEGRTGGDGTLTGSGTLDFRNRRSHYALDFQTQQFAIATLRPYRPDLPLAAHLTSQGQLQGDFKQPSSLRIEAAGQLKLAQGAIAIEQGQLQGQRWQGRLTAQGIDPKQLPFLRAQGLNGGSLHGVLQIAGDLGHSTLDQLQAQGSAQLQLPQGRLRADSLTLAQGRWQGQFWADKVALASWLPNLPRAWAGNLDGQLKLAGDLSGRPQALVGRGEGHLSLSQGLIKARQVQVSQGRWSGQFIPQNLSVQPFLAAAQSGDRLQGNLTLLGTLERPRQTLSGQGSARLTLHQGKLNLPRLTLTGDQVQATLWAKEIPLRPFSPRLRGKVSGQIDLTASLASWQPDRLTSQGNLTFSEGIGALARPFTTDFVWNGHRLQLRPLQAPDLTAQGWVDVLFRDRNPQIQGFDLAIRTQNFPMQDLSLPATLPLQSVTGNLDFAGHIAGTLQQPQIKGNLVLTQVQSPLLPLTLDPVLQGQIQSKPHQGLSLNLAGKQDSLALRLDSRYQLTELDLSLAQLRLRGRQQQSQFLIEVERLPLPLLQAIAKVNPALSQFLPVALRPSFLDPSLSGDLSGRIWLNRQAHSLIGEEITILNPRWGTLKGDRLTGNFQYRNGQFTLSAAQFQINQSRYQLSGNAFPQKDGMHWQGEIAMAPGNIQDILTALQIYDLEDLKRGGNPPTYGKAADLYPPAALPPRSPSAPLPALYGVSLPAASRDRLSDFSAQLKAFEDQRQQRRQGKPLPTLAELKGTIEGRLQLTFSPQSGLLTAFALQGQNWQWGTYPPLQLLAQGSFHRGILTLEPFNLRIGTHPNQVHFVGQIGGQQQQGQLQVINLPLPDIVPALSQALSFASPLDLGGWLNGILSIGGNRQNPQAKGQWRIERASFNQQDLPFLQGEFTYRNSRFDVSAQSTPSSPRDPLRLTGSFPLRLPFATVAPQSDRWEARLLMQDEDLRLFNLFTGRQLDWVSGKGILQLEAKGRVDPQNGLFQELQVQGLTQFKEVTLSSAMLPIPLTHVQGKMDFTLDRIAIENLTGQLSGGNFILHGSLPIQPSFPLSPSPLLSPSLQLTFNDLLLDLPNLYQGRVKGDIQWLGSLVNPAVGGQIELFNGQILLGDPLKETHPSEATKSLLEFTNFNLILGENVLITRSPIIRLLAKGNLLLNGTIDQLKPEGIIALKNGQVNLFASQLRLAAGETNTAEFAPQWGFDPYLNLRLVTAVSETNRNVVRSNPLSSEINDPFTANNDSLQTVRIQAQVRGLASQLARNIDLTSTPPRNRSEIITLLGGSFVNTLSSGDTTVGLANLAGTAVFGPVQGTIGDALGLSEFRIFSTPLINDQERIRSTQIGVAVEAGIDLTQDLSFSILQILNADRPPQFGLRYRINENTILRGSSNFSDDNRGVIEYEHRF